MKKKWKISLRTGKYEAENIRVWTLVKSWLDVKGDVNARRIVFKETTGEERRGYKKSLITARDGAAESIKQSCY